MKKTTTFVRILSALMATIMVAVAIPVQAIALPVDELEQIQTEQIQAVTETAVTNAPAEQDIFIVEEDTSKRGQFEKHYLCSDGTYVSVTYPEAVHYLDDDQTWKDVDQSLTYNATTGTYASEQADFRVSFSGKASATNMAQIERNGHTLSWGIQTASKSAVRSSEMTYAQSSRAILDEVKMVTTSPSEKLAQVAAAPSVSFESNAERLVSNEDSFLLPNISAQISYADVFAGENVSLKYTVYHNKVEEDIIISERGDIHSVSMNMDVGTLTPVVNADGSVDLVDETNAMQFHVGIPYMMDADFSVCNDIEVTAEKTGTTCIITYTPNAEWFDSSERIFPILLDPSITTNEYVANMYDTYVEENAPANHSGEQFMYVNPNGENQRKAIVQIRQLPAIDASMPIVRAQLTLTTQYAPFSDMLLQAEYGVTDLHVLEYDYDIADAFAPSFTALAYLTTDQTAVWFDFTPHIYQMYADEAYAAEVGKIYMGDFVIGFADSATPKYVYPFHTSESTTPANRPVFKVNYGYSLPAGMLNGGIYSFVNYGSYSYMSVNGTEPANNSNVYQIWPTNGNPTNAQKFKLEYVESTGGYLLRSMASSAGAGKVVDIQRGGGSIYSGRNVQIYSATDPISQEWLIVPVDYYLFRIIPRSNMSLALTAYGYDDGTNTGKTSTSEGNIFVRTLVEGDAFQEWYIYDNDGYEVCIPEHCENFETGDYYIVNSYVGRYLHRSDRTANCARNPISFLGEDTVKWKIVNLEDGYYTIQRSDIAGYCLAPSSTSGNPVYVYQNQSETIPDRYKWSITIADGGGCLIRNKETALYLKALVSTTNPSSVSVAALSGEGTVGYRQQTWCIVSEDDYVELNQSVTFNDITIDFGVPQAASVNRTPSNAYFASYTDFDYTITSGSDCLTYDVSTYKFTGVAPGTATVRATHKLTGISRSFCVNVECFVTSLIDQDLVSCADIRNTDDGFYMLTKPLSYILNSAGIYDLVGDLSGDDITNVLCFYDDWYIFAVKSEDSYDYGLLKMREQEFDHVDSDGDGKWDADGDNAGVTISFVDFDYNRLLSLINTNSQWHSYKLVMNLNSVVGPGEADYGSGIAAYFVRVESKAAYLIANEYVEFIANVSCVNNVIAVPQNYVDSDGSMKTRVRNALLANNSEAGYLIFDEANNVINIIDKNNLTIYEKYAILATHTANVTFNSFAAEVQYHADALDNLLIVGLGFYERALRADMAMGEEYESGFADAYYDLNSEIVQAQIRVHGEY